MNYADNLMHLKKESFALSTRIHAEKQERNFFFSFEDLKDLVRVERALT